MKTSDAGISRIPYIIKEIDDEREIDNGWWIILKPGFIIGPDGTHQVHESTLTYCAAKLNMVEPCNCEDCGNRLMERNGSNGN